MERLLIVYATREGHTRRVADRLSGSLQSKGMFVEVADAARLTAELDLRSYDGVILAGSVHVGRHEPELIRFVKQHRAALQQLRAAFVSVSMSQAAVESTSTTRKQREEATARVRAAFALFEHETGWTPDRTLAVAGALLYRHYWPIVRFIMRAKARSAGAPTDVKRDHVLTDWSALDRFGEDFLRDHGGETPRVSIAS
jgi:menaquinone-dependent protoporphyrinogen oxidase